MGCKPTKSEEYHNVDEAVRFFVYTFVGQVSFKLWDIQFVIYRKKPGIKCFVRINNRVRTLKLCYDGVRYYFYESGHCCWESSFKLTFFSLEYNDHSRIFKDPISKLILTIKRQMGLEIPRTLVPKTSILKTPEYPLDKVCENDYYKHYDEHIELWKFIFVSYELSIYSSDKNTYCYAIKEISGKYLYHIKTSNIFLDDLSNKVMVHTKDKNVDIDVGYLKSFKSLFIDEQLESSNHPEVYLPMFEHHYLENPTEEFLDYLNCENSDSILLHHKLTKIFDDDNNFGLNDYWSY